VNNKRNNDFKIDHKIRKLTKLPTEIERIRRENDDRVTRRVKESEKAMVMRDDRTENEDKRRCPDDLGCCGVMQQVRGSCNRIGPPIRTAHCQRDRVGAAATKWHVVCVSSRLTKKFTHGSCTVSHATIQWKLVKTRLENSFISRKHCLGTCKITSKNIWLELVMYNRT